MLCWASEDHAIHRNNRQMSAAEIKQDVFPVEAIRLGNVLDKTLQKPKKSSCGSVVGGCREKLHQMSQATPKKVVWMSQAKRFIGF